MFCKKQLQFGPVLCLSVLFTFCNSLVGSIDILLLFFLQAKLPGTGLSGFMLGFTLFFMEMGGILGARLILKLLTHGGRRLCLRIR